MTPGSVRPSGYGRPPLTPPAWRTTVTGVHLFTAVILALAMVGAVLGDSDDVPGRRPVAAAAVAALALAYAVVGARAVARHDERLAVGYLVVLVAAVAAVAWATPGLLFLLTVAYPQVWFLARSYRNGLAWTVILAAVSTLTLAAGLAGTGGSPFSAVTDMLTGLVFSVVMGFFMSRVMAQSEQRAELICELERTRSQLAEAHHSAGVLAERERFARDVHDTLAQGYTSVVVLAQTAQAELATAPERVADRLDLIAEVARDNLQEARALVAAMSPVALDGSTLAEALQRLADRFGRETGLQVEVATGGLGDGLALSRDGELVLLRAAQEALANARRHALARRVRLSLVRAGAELVLRVEDDGVGFDVAAAAGTGLAGLRSRLEQAGGALDVQSGVGSGTRLAARLPVTAPV